jgi:enediyne biosynthesis protein E4
MSIGEFTEADHRFAEAYAADPDCPRLLLANIEALRGVAAMRRGETENCVACCNGSSCIFPLTEEAIHQIPSGSREAIRHFTSYLTQRPEDLGVKWLLNIAYMTLGDYPDRVPSQYLIPLGPFQSDGGVRRLENIAGRVGLSARGANMSGGSIVDDFTGDGLLDVFYSTKDVTQGCALFVNRGDGTFEDRSALAGLEPQVGALNCNHADYDNDGDLDVLLLRGGWETPRRPSLLRNEGDGRFTDVTVAACLWQPIASQAAAWADFDCDGHVDLYIAGEFDPRKPDLRNRGKLYRNNGNGTFTDVAEKAGVHNDRFGKGVAWGDYDDDGRPDLYIANLGQAKRLYHNNGNGTFTDVTAKAGVADDGQWSTSAGWFDYDKDGWLDLVVTNYIDWSPKNNIYCGEHRAGYRSYCHPGNYKGEHIKLYHNNHDGTFTDVSDASGVGKPEAKGMGVVLADFNNDGWPDIAVANDSWPNFLFINKHDGTFADVSLFSGLAASEDGSYEAGMGIDAADVDGDGWMDVYITHLDFELNRLYRNSHDGTFTDETFRSGLGNKAVLMSGVAMKFLDYDNDGWNDILQANGSMLDNVALYHDEVSYKEPMLMFRNRGKGQFEKVSESLGPDFMRPIVGRGLATADYDNDGDIDIVTNNRGAYPSFLRNDGGNANHWLTVLLIGTKSDRDGTGASLKLTSEGFVHIEQAKGGGSYMSASDPRIHFGLGKRTKIESLEITWPSGQVDRLTNLTPDQIVAVKDGSGMVPRPFPKIPGPK